jgi:hypothetical protein
MEVVQFGRDLLWTIRELQVRGQSDNLDSYDDAVAKFLLFDWGLTPEGVDESNRLFWQQVERESLGDFVEALKRIVDIVSENDDRKQHLVRDLAAVIQTQRAEINDKQRTFLNGFQEILDMKPSEFQNALERGGELGVALSFVGKAYSSTLR